MNTHILNPLHDLARRGRGAIARMDYNRKEWIEATLELATVFFEARSQFESNEAFGDWIVQEHLDSVNKDERAALIQMGSNLELASEALTHTTRWSARLILDEEFTPRLRSAAKTVTTGEILQAQPEQPENAVVMNNGDHQTHETTTGESSSRSSSEVQGPKLRGDNALRKFERGQEVWNCFTDRNTRTLLAKTVSGRGGKEIYSLILEAIDLGFLQPSNVSGKIFSARMLFSGSSNSRTSVLGQLDLTKDKARQEVIQNIMPAARAKREQILSDRNHTDAIIREYHNAQAARQKEQVQAKRLEAAIAKLPQDQSPVVMYGKSFWPIEGTWYDYDQVRAAAWTVITWIRMLTLGPDNSPVSVGMIVRQHIKFLSEYCSFRNELPPMKRIFGLMREMSFAYQENPKAESKMPPTPNMEGRW